MKILWLLVLAILVTPMPTKAAETKIMYFESKIPGPQVTKAYYIKESLKRVDPKNQNILQVKTNTIVTSPEGTTEYRVTYQFNCDSQMVTIVAYWSSGFGNDNGTMVNGKWKNVTDFDDSAALAQKVCMKPKK